MRCEDFPVTDIVDGVPLAPEVRHEADTHLAACAACRALVADLRTIRAAAFTLERHEPPADLLARIEARRASLHGGTAGVLPWRGDRQGWFTWMAAAATLVVAIGAGLALLLEPPAEAPSAAVSAPALLGLVQADLQAAESHYDRAIRGLEQIARTDTGVLDPQVAAVLQNNLQVVDRAIDENRAALRVQPASTTAQDGLFDAMRAKVALLQQTVELINEMRKGNQAEAGRLMQDFPR